MSKTEIVHQDKLGRPLKVNDCIATVDHNSLVIGRITKINPKMIKVKPVNTRYEKNKYPSDCVLLDEAEVTMYILRNQK